MAKFKDSINIKGEAKIAVPIIVLEGEETEGASVNALNKTGYYDFKVKNYDETQVSNIAQKYTIEIIANVDESVEFKLFRDEEEVMLDENKTEEVRMGCKDKEEHNYRLEVSYDKDRSQNETDILEDVQIKVHSTQESL
jgi:hypothetical protein